MFEGLPKKAPEAISQGDPLYYDATNDELTKTSATGLFLVGAAVAGAASADAEMTALLDGVIREPVPAPPAG
ncbi:hypothetical protein D3C72_2562300 [compost metagenome]